MKEYSASFLIVSLLVLLAFGRSSDAQRPGSDDRADIDSLIKKLEHDREFDTQESSMALIKIGQGAIPKLTSSLMKSDDCTFKLNAAEVVRKIDPTQKIVKTALLDVAAFKCEHKLTGTMADKHLFILNVHATGILVEEVEGGIPLVAEFYKSRDRSVRSNAALAFSGLAERLDRQSPNKIALKPDMIRAAKAAIPILVKALDDEDQFVRCRTYAALWRMQRSENEELQIEAKRALKGVSDRCRG